MTQIALDITKSIAAPTKSNDRPASEGEFADRLATASDKPDAPKSAESKDPPQAKRSEDAAPADSSYEEQPVEAPEEHGNDADTSKAPEETADLDEAAVVADVHASGNDEDLIELTEEGLALAAQAEDETDSDEQTDESATEELTKQPGGKTPVTAAGTAGQPDTPAVPDEEIDQAALAAAADDSADEQERPAQVSPNETEESLAATPLESEAPEVAVAAAATEVTKPSPQSGDSGQVESESTATQQTAPVESQTASDDQQGDSGDEPTGQPRTSKGKNAPSNSAFSQTTDKQTDAAETQRDLPPEPSGDSGRVSQAESKTEPAPGQSVSRSLDRIAAGRLSPTRSESAPGAAQADRVDAARFVGRVSKAFDSAQARGETVRLRLSPPELGAMQIKLSMSSEGAMTASVETETSAARNIMLDNLPALRERLAEMEIRVEKFDVDVRQDGRGQQDWTAGEDRQEGESQSDTPTQETSNDEPATTQEVTPQGPGTQSTGPDQINLVA